MSKTIRNEPEWKRDDFKGQKPKKSKQSQRQIRSKQREQKFKSL